MEDLLRLLVLCLLIAYANYSYVRYKNLDFLLKKGLVYKDDEQYLQHQKRLALGFIIINCGLIALILHKFVIHFLNIWTQ